MGISSIDFAYLRQLVWEHSAVALDADKEYLAELHLGSLAQLQGFDSISSLVENLRTKPFSGLHMQAIEALITYETSFYRDVHPFESLKNFVLPEILERRGVERTLNIWCAACSSGQEPYSIAMLIREHFPMLVNWKLRLIASDFSSKILTRARKGRYNQYEINRGLSKTLRDKYFQQQDSEWQVKEEIRQMVEFQQLNLIESWQSLPDMDIIFLRNVLIYFDIETKKTVLAKVRQLLKPDGYLFLGGGETTINIDESFRRVQLGKSICHRLQ
ncbi:MAG: CheR family methyltransferase [Heteroscytonema crispum UTEX LB 1556]